MGQEANLSDWPSDLIQVFAALGVAMAGKRLNPELVKAYEPAWRFAIPGHTVSIKHGAKGSTDAGCYLVSIDGERWRGAGWRIRSGMLERLYRLAATPAANTSARRPS